MLLPLNILCISPAKQHCTKNNDSPFTYHDHVVFLTYKSVNLTLDSLVTKLYRDDDHLKCVL